MTGFPKTLGLVAAPFTPLNADGSINLAVIERYANWLFDNGVVGAFVCGTTGEGPSLSIEERMQVAKRWTQVAPAGLKIIVHVGHTSLQACRDLAAHAQAVGAHSSSCMAPFFFKPNGVDGLVAWCEQVAAAAPDLPFYYYHIPSMTGVSLPVHPFLESAKNRIPNLAGIKYTYEDLDDCSQCAHLDGGRFDVLFGRDELLLAALQRGIEGAVGSTYNFAAPLFRDVMHAFHAGDLRAAEEHQRSAVQMIDTLIKGGPQPVATFKWFMSKVAVDCGPPRLPLEPLAKEQCDALEQQLVQLPCGKWMKA